MTLASPVRPDEAVDLSVRIGSLVLKSPVLPASGCFGPQIGEAVSLSGVGASVTKTVFLERRGGNRPHRVTETALGTFNSVGIPSYGPAEYLRHLHPRYRALGIPVITSVGAHHTAGYAEVLRVLGDAADAYEMNVSCPNLDNHGVEIGADPSAIADAVTLARAVTRRPLIVKLSPMVSSIVDCARAAQDAGADAVSISNTIPALPLDPRTLAPILGNTVGGLSGPTIRAVVLRLVWLAAESLSIPVIGCGGVETASDALEYFSVGAQAVQVGTATFAHPAALPAIAHDLRETARRRHARTMKQAVAAIQAGR